MARSLGTTPQSYGHCPLRRAATAVKEHMHCYFMEQVDRETAVKDTEKLMKGRPELQGC